MLSTRLLVRRTAAAAVACSALSGELAAAAERDADQAVGAATQEASGPSITSGLASFYSQRLAGRATASGEPYDPAALTAAHRSLPLGTQLRVVNPQNQRGVVVTINDRGPALKKRLIDLSAAAAHALGIQSSGVARVETHVVRDRLGVALLRPTLEAATEALTIAPFERH